VVVVSAQNWSQKASSVASTGCGEQQHQQQQQQQQAHNNTPTPCWGEMVQPYKRALFSFYSLLAEANCSVNTAPPSPRQHGLVWSGLVWSGIPVHLQHREEEGLVWLP